MGWKNITKASVSYNLSKEWFWSNDDEYERIMKADDKKVESGTTDLGDKIKDYETMLDNMLDSIKNMDGKTISGDDIKTSEALSALPLPFPLSEPPHAARPSTMVAAIKNAKILFFIFVLLFLY